MTIDKHEINPVKGLNRPMLEDSLNAWYRKGFATWEEVGSPGKDGKWGGSLHRLSVTRASGDRIRLQIDFGSVEKFNGCVGELQAAITSSGYRVSSSNLDNGFLYVRPVR